MNAETSSQVLGYSPFDRWCERNGFADAIPLPFEDLYDVIEAFVQDYDGEKQTLKLPFDEEDTAQPC